MRLAKILRVLISCNRRSGHYDIPPVVWVNAHWHQFAQPGWRFLKRASENKQNTPAGASSSSSSGGGGSGGGSGSGWLPAGGSYVTLVPPDGSAHPPHTFTMVIETLARPCPFFLVLGSPHVTVIELRLALISYRDHRMLP